jgi:hypothetical protein
MVRVAFGLSYMNKAARLRTREQFPWEEDGTYYLMALEWFRGDNRTFHVRDDQTSKMLNDDQSDARFTDRWGELKTVEFTYRVVRVWEQPRQAVIEQRLVGLYPLLPLMKGEAGEDPKQVLQQDMQQDRWCQALNLLTYRAPGPAPAGLFLFTAGARFSIRSSSASCQSPAGCGIIQPQEE